MTGPPQTLAGMNEWCVDQHGKTGLTQACRESKVSCREAEDRLLALLAEVTKKGECPLAGNSVGQDRRSVQ